MDKLEPIAEKLHEAWMEYQTKYGRVFGPERTPTTHPHMLPWDQLDGPSQNQDRFIAAVVLDEWARGRLAVEDVPPLSQTSCPIRWPRRGGSGVIDAGGVRGS
jgi:hypothetical protein